MVSIHALLRNPSAYHHVWHVRPVTPQMGCGVHHPRGVQAACVAEQPRDPVALPCASPERTCTQAPHRACSYPGKERPVRTRSTARPCEKQKMLNPLTRKLNSELLDTSWTCAHGSAHLTLRNKRLPTKCVRMAPGQTSAHRGRRAWQS